MCPYCKKTIQSDSAFCINCGSDLRYPKNEAPSLATTQSESNPSSLVVHCNYCQNTSPNDSNFCVHCGKKLGVVSPSKPEEPTNELQNFESSLSKKLSSAFNILILIAAIASISGFIYFYVENRLSTSADKNAINEEIIDNLYRNTKYKFRIKFPDKWKIEKGDGPNVLIKATNENGSSINILVKDFGVAIGDIDEMISLDEWAESFYEKFPDAKILLKKEISIDNRKAFIVKSSVIYKTLDKEANSTIYSVALTSSNFFYTITASAKSRLFEDERLIMETSISTFVIENY